MNVVTKVETVLKDLRGALRNLARMGAAGAAAVLMLTLGIGVTTTMFSVLYAALLRPVPFAQPDRLVILYVTRTTPRDGLQRLRWSRPSIATLEEAVSSFETLASFTPANVSIGSLESTGGESTGRKVEPTGGLPEQVDGEIVSPDYFHALRVTPIEGRTFRGDDDTAPGGQPVVVLSERLWRRHFAADPFIVGRAVRVNDVPLTVVGIMSVGFAGLSGKADLWIPRTMAPQLTYSDYLTTPQHFINVLARLKPGVSLETANAELTTVGARFADRDQAPDARWSSVARSLDGARVDVSVRRSVLLLLGAASCVLLIACVNVASLLMARGRTRRREMAIRLAIGSSRGRIIRQLLAEGFVLASIAGAAGMVLSVWGMDVVARTAPAIVASFRNDYSSIGPFATPSLDVAVVVFVIATTLGTTILASLVPALEASGPDLVSALKDEERAGRPNALGSFVVSEIALAVLLLVGAGLLVDSYANLQQRRVGFEPDGVLTFWVRPPNSRYSTSDGPAIVERLLTRIEQVRGVDAAAVNRCTPFLGCARTTIFFPERPFDRMNAPAVGRHYVSADYFRALGIPLRRGRVLTREDRNGHPPVAVVNETGARRFWPGEDPIGKHVWFGSSTGFTNPARPVEIVGVVGDVKYESADREMNADFYTSYLQFSYPDTMMIVKARGLAQALVLPLRTAVASVDPALPIFDVMTLDDRIDAALARPRFNASGVALFAAAALLLAALGVYGVLSYSVSVRVREIGVRLALGADPSRVMRLVVGDGARLALLGSCIGLLIALAAGRFMRSLLVGVTPSDPRLLGAAALVMVAVAIIAAALPARRAARVDPLIALRNQ